MRSMTDSKGTGVLKRRLSEATLSRSGKIDRCISAHRIPIGPTGELDRGPKIFDTIIDKRVAHFTRTRRPVILLPYSTTHHVTNSLSKCPEIRRAGGQDPISYRSYQNQEIASVREAALQFVLPRTTNQLFG